MLKKRILYVSIPIILALTPILIVGCVGTPDLSSQMSHQGRLLDSAGAPVADGNYSFRYRIYHSATGGTPVYTETKTVAVSDGLFDTILGASSVITPDIFAQPSWIEIAVDGETLTPRQKLLGAPYAFSLSAGAVVQGSIPITRTFSGVANTGAAMTVWNDNRSATGGNGLFVVNQAAADTSSASDKGVPVAALQALAVGGQDDSSPQSGAYGAIINSENYRGMYARGATNTAGTVNWYAAVFDSGTGINLIGGGTCTGCTLAYFATNSGAESLQPGDFVAAQGVIVDPDLNVPVMQVVKATSATDPVIGVVSSAMNRAPVGDYYGVKSGGFDAREGAAANGEYLSVVVQGLVQARTSELEIKAGEWLTLQSGALEVAPTGGLARAMSSPDENGMVWVLYNGQ
jgi:hypothetical protein